MFRNYFTKVVSEGQKQKKCQKMSGEMRSNEQIQTVFFLMVEAKNWLKFMSALNEGNMNFMQRL